MKRSLFFSIFISLMILLAAWGLSVMQPSQVEPVEAKPAAQTQLLQSTGKLTMLRAHDLGTGFGPGSDFLDVEVVIRLDTAPGKSFGFQMRDDNKLPARQAMFSLLRDAFNNNWTVTTDYYLDVGKNNGEIIRVWLTK